jgi:glycosyltransferase involved in cell wall biosynthesis
VSDRSVGLVHDYLLVMRGAERTFAAIAECFPEAPIYTLLYDAEGTSRAFDGREVRTSYRQRLGATQGSFRRLLPLFPRAAERLPVQEHDLVISSSSAFAHAIRPDPGAIYICYCHSPFRYAWFERERAEQELPRPLRPLLRVALDRVRKGDLAASRRVTHYIANSEATRRRIEQYWGRDATVIHPPVDVHRFALGEPEDYLLMVTELVPHKRVDVALEAARRAGKRIKVVGAGPELRRLQADYRGTAEFLGRIDDEALASVYARARALVVPNVEEFGIAAVEAQAAGRPVVGADAGGVRETVVPGKTGILVTPGDVDELTSALGDGPLDAFSPAEVRAHALTFSKDSFKERLVAEVERVLESR